MPTPSLILVPARFKTGKLYTPLATTSGGVVLGASGDFNVTRATTATRFNANGNIEVVASGVPRLDYYTSGGTAGCPALLVEPSAQNSALQSENFGTTWGAVNLLAFGSGSVLNTTGTLDPYGTNVADLIVPNTSLNQHRLDQTTASASGSYTFSVFVKRAGYDFARLRIGLAGANFNLASGTITATDSGIISAIQSYGNGWYRCIVSKAVSAANEIIRINVGNSASVPDFEGNGTSGIYVFGAQYESGTVATSYIPTTTASATRNADVITLSGAVSGCVGQTEGTIYAEVDMTSQSGVTRTLLTLSDGTTTNRIRFRLTTATNLEMERTVSGSVNASLNVTVPASGVSKIALGYNASASGYVIYVNGSSAGTIAAATPTFTNQLTRIDIGSNIGSSPQFNDRIRSAALYTTRLTDTELAALTTL
jgi:hypothetical protein